MDFLKKDISDMTKEELQALSERILQQYKENHKDDERREDDLACVEENTREWCEEYPDRWVAVYKRQRVAVSEDEDYKDFEESLIRQGFDPKKLVIRFMSSHRGPLILTAALA